MKYAIFTDIHGKDLSELERALSFEKSDVLICMSDFDQVSSIRQFMELEEKYKNNGKKVIVVPGNHDHSILFGLEFSSETLWDQNKTFEQLYHELKNDSIARNYISTLINKRSSYKNKPVEPFLERFRLYNKFNCAVVHGALSGDMSSWPGCPSH